MRARLQKFLPLVLLALAMQVFAPIAACWSVGQPVADPLSAAVICHSTGEQGGLNDQTGTPAAHGAACALCCLAQAGASLDSPPQLALSIPFRHAERISWRAAEVPPVAAHQGSHAQARAPPHLS